MKKFIFGSLLLGALGALASTIVPLGQVVWQETQAGTRAAPDGGCACPANGSNHAGNLGFCLNQQKSVHAIAQCSDGSNITAGSENGWYCSPALNTWIPAQTYANCTLPTGAPSGLCTELSVAQPFGRFLFQSVGVTCSGGSWDGGVLVSVERAQQ